MLIEWKDRFNTGFIEIDNQHKKLIDIINQLAQTSHIKKHEISDSVFIELINYTKTHFEYEEKMLAAKNYPDYNRHKREHDIFVNKIIEYYKMFTNKADVFDQLFGFLKHWLINHILRNDIDYSNFYGKYKS